MIPFIHVFFVAYYIMNANGTMNTSFSVTNATSWFTTSNKATNGLLNWSIPLIPFIIILVGLSFILPPASAGAIASLVAAGIALIDTGLLGATQALNLPLYTFTSALIVFCVAFYLTDVAKPYN
ncbi:MAG: hypothetical protein KGH64_00735 [Candidatus Micrarchaeota archaeon]|nr:hypothetical protein [Candidatus Micrarchaeota archaeon]